MIKLDALIVGDGIQAHLISRSFTRKNFRTVMLSSKRQHYSQLMSSQCYLHRGHFYKSGTLVDDLAKSIKFWDELTSKLPIEVCLNRSYSAIPKSKEEEWTTRWRANGLTFVREFHSELKCSSTHSVFKIDASWIDGVQLLSALRNLNADSSMIGDIYAVNDCGSHFEVTISTHSGLKTLLVTDIILSRGTGNQALAKTILGRDNIDIQQIRRCQVLVLEGKLPSLSTILPEDQLFIVPTMNRDKPRWICTYGTDEVSDLDVDSTPAVDVDRLRKCQSKISEVFPALDFSSLKAGIYPSWKAECLQAGQGKRPDSYTIREISARITAIWPTKLTLAPLAADELADRFENNRSSIPRVSLSKTENIYHKATSTELAQASYFLENIYNNA